MAERQGSGYLRKQVSRSVATLLQSHARAFESRWQLGDVKPLNLIRSDSGARAVWIFRVGLWPFRPHGKGAVPASSSNTPHGLFRRRTMGGV